MEDKILCYKCFYYDKPKCYVDKETPIFIARKKSCGRSKAKNKSVAKRHKIQQGEG